MVIQMTSTCDRRSKQTVRKHDLNNNDPYLVKFHRNGPQSKIRKAPKVYDYPCSLVMARENPRRSQHKKVATPEDLPATGMTVSLGGTQVTSEPHFTSGASLASDASIDDTLSAPAFGPHGKIIEGSVLGKRSRRDIDDRLEEQDERGEADMLGENALDSPIVEDSRSSGRNDILEEMSPDETCARNNGSSFEPGILMKEHVVLDHATALYPIASETQRITSYHTSPVSMRGEESDSTEAAGLTTADTSEEPQTPDPLTWRPAHGVTAIGVHSFNMPFDDLRKMILLQALEQSQKRQPQSSNKIRALFVSAVTDEQTAPESYTFEHARVKLQAGRNAVYGIQLKERMASLRMFAPNAMQESREVVDGLTAAVHEAREELAAARKALDGDIEIYATVKQELKNIIGVFISEADIPAIEEDALRRYNMISEINAAIVKYGNIWWSQTVRKEREVELEHWIERLEQQTGNGSGNDAFPAGCWAHVCHPKGVEGLMVHGDGDWYCRTTRLYYRGSGKSHICLELESIYRFAVKIVCSCSGSDFRHPSLIFKVTGECANERETNQNNITSKRPLRDYHHVLILTAFVPAPPISSLLIPVRMTVSEHAERNTRFTTVSNTRTYPAIQHDSA